MSKPVLFYSPNCQFCINLWKKLKTFNILDKIIKININKTAAPNYIKSVPTLIVEGREPLTGDSIIMYFNSLEPSKPSLTNKVDNKINTTSNEIIQDYLPGEMSNSWSDNYSFLDESAPIKHSYSFIDSSNQTAPPINNAHINNAPINDTDKEVDINKKLEEYKNYRKDDLRYPKY